MKKLALIALDMAVALGAGIFIGVVVERPSNQQSSAMQNLAITVSSNYPHISLSKVQPG